jgi:L-lysine exporter family protein LysE/ArgO
MDGFCVAPFVEGCGTGAGLIIAIGAQNAFVLKQGIVKNHVLITVLICALIDALLICIGVGGFGVLLTSNILLLTIAR